MASTPLHRPEGGNAAVRRLDVVPDAVPSDAGAVRRSVHGLRPRQRLGLKLASIDFVAAPITFAAIGWARGAGLWRGELQNIHERIHALGFTALRAWPLVESLALAALIGFATLAVYRSVGVYRAAAETGRGPLRVVIEAECLLFVLLAAALWILGVEEVSRLAVASSIAVKAFAIGCIHRVIWDRWARRIETQSGALDRVLLVGSGREARALVSALSQRPDFGISIVGYVDDRPSDLDLPHLGRVDDIPHLFEELAIDQIAICEEHADLANVDRAMQMAIAQGKGVRVVFPGSSRWLSVGKTQLIQGLPVLTLASDYRGTPAYRLKRIFDALTAFSLLVLLSPLLVAIALVIAIAEGRPVLFRQSRAGLHGRPFTLLKFRTMVRDAELKKSTLASRNERIGPAFKITGDPRVTRVGRFLRRWSLDELPQLVNVMRGEMSLVGPRPQPLEEVRHYDLWHRRRLAMPPGITGLWQVTARDNNEFDEWVRLDLEYIDRWSLWRDLSILLRTPHAIHHMRGE